MNHMTQWLWLAQHKSHHEKLEIKSFLKNHMITGVRWHGGAGSGHPKSQRL